MANDPLASLFGGDSKSVTRKAVEAVLNNPGETSLNLPDDFHGVTDHPVELQREKPIHRAMVLLKLQGLTNRQIGEQVDYSATAVGIVLRQPWARKMMADAINQTGGDSVRQLLKAEMLATTERMLDLRDDPKTPAPVVRQTCVDLWDRFMGKPTQQVAVTHNELAQKSPEELEKEIEVLKSEENRLMGIYTS